MWKWNNSQINTKIWSLREHLQHNLSAYRPQQNITVRMMYIKDSQNKAYKLNSTQLNK